MFYSLKTINLTFSTCLLVKLIILLSDLKNHSQNFDWRYNYNDNLTQILEVIFHIEKKKTPTLSLKLPIKLH